MADEQLQLLSEIASSQRKLQEQIASMDSTRKYIEAAYTDFQAEYRKSQAKYRENDTASKQTYTWVMWTALAFRVITLLLLVYIAWRVS